MWFRFVGDTLAAKWGGGSQTRLPITPNLEIPLPGLIPSGRFGKSVALC